MYCFSISKYDPNLFVNKKYLLDDWTDYSDVGKIFNNQLLTLDIYCSVELNYINFIKDIVEFADVNAFFIGSLELYENVKWKNGQIIDVSQLEQLIKDCLRNKCWCKIYNDVLCFCFGYDFYLRLCIDTEKDNIEKIASKHLLYAKIADEINTGNTGDGSLCSQER